MTDKYGKRFIACVKTGRYALAKKQLKHIVEEKINDKLQKNINKLGETNE